MTTFKQMRDRIAADLRRSNLDTEIGYAINDAIAEAAKQRFYFNEMHDLTFDTVALTERYDDKGLVEIDAAWYMQGTTRYNLEVYNDLDANMLAEGNPVGGQLEYISRYGGQLRLYPIPNSVITVHLDGYGKLTPSPLAADGDTNAWLADGELYIRALAKRNILRDVVRNYQEAAVLDGIADDYRMQLEMETTLRSAGDNTLQATCF